MNETQIPAPPSPPPPPPREAHTLDTPGSKIFFSLICFIAPVPLTIVITDFWLRYQGQLPENAISPLHFIKLALSVGGFGSMWPLLLSLVPPALLLIIIFRTPRSRMIMLVLLAMAALLQFTGLASLTTL